MFLSTSFPRTQGKPIMYLCHAKNHQKSSLFLHKTKYFQAMFLNNSRQQPNHGRTRRADWGCWQGRVGLCRFSGHLKFGLFINQFGSYQDEMFDVLSRGWNVRCYLQTNWRLQLVWSWTWPWQGQGPVQQSPTFCHRFPHNVATAASNSGKLSTQLFSWQTWPNQSGY